MIGSVQDPLGVGELQFPVATVGVDGVGGIHVTCIDFTLLSAFALFWVYNNMTTRKWDNKGSWLLPLSIIPFLGPALYLLLRPSLVLISPNSRTASEASPRARTRHQRHLRVRSTPSKPTRAAHAPGLAVTSALRNVTSACDVSPGLCDVSPVMSALELDRNLDSLLVLSCLRYILYGTSWLHLSPSGYVLVILLCLPLYRDQQRLILFLMGLSDIYEPVRASLLHRIPLPTLEQAISELLSKETRLGLVSTSHVDTALATPGSRGRGSSSGSRGFSAFGSQSSGGSASRPNECTFCHATDHRLLNYPIRVCKNCCQRGPGHYRFCQPLIILLLPCLPLQDPQTGQTLEIGRRHGRLFQLIHLHLPISTAATTSTSSSSPSFGIWHSRLGHVVVGSITFSCI
ncbi:hypothetical protein Acr_17g0009380 [Actinidia rufa]|uniref:Cardiolipin synthase N-terminal domain-containing protein n=1 Tax=Actinidia rufa TaxID=165716 RepID=A0A7J0G3J9_9ERIC|nr:hypothetical protein Acr_17g0009380 [Actinidia rufa]